MSTCFGVPATRQLLLCMRTWITVPVLTTCTVSGLKAHESTVVRRFTSSKGRGAAGTNVEAAFACRARREATSAAPAATDFTSDIDAPWKRIPEYGRHYRAAPAAGRY